MKIKNKCKFIRRIALILIILSFFFCKATLSYKSRRFTYNKIYIAKGDTLWSIAVDLRNNNSYYKNKDIRDIIYEIKTLNHLSNGNLYINQELLITSICN